MVDTKINDLPVIASIVAADELAVVDDPAGSPTTTKATMTQILTFLLSQTNTWIAAQTFVPPVNTSAIIGSGYSLTGTDATSMVNLAGTWNTTGIPTAIKFNVTDTASNAASLLLDLQAGAASKFSVSKAGVVTTVSVTINQSSTTGAKPVITLDQGDIDEDYFKFIGISDTSVDRALVDAANFTTPGAIVGWLKINVQDDQGTAPIVDGDYYIPFYAAPTA